VDAVLAVHPPTSRLHEPLLRTRFAGMAPQAVELDRAVGAHRRRAWWVALVGDTAQVGARGDLAGAIAAGSTLLDDCLTSLGPDHPSTLLCRRDLAHWQGRAGDQDAAIASLTELLTHCLRVLSTNHPVIALTRQELAHWQQQAEASG
jgi:hypothetical protein